MRHYVKYVDDTTPYLAEFSSKKAAQEFITKFTPKINPRAGTWIDYSFSTNNLVIIDDTVNLVKKKSPKKKS